MVTFYSYIVNFIVALGLGFSKSQTHHVLTFIHGIILTDGEKTVSNILRSTHETRDLSCMTRFLNESPWYPNRANRRRIQFMMDKIKKIRAKQGDTRLIVFLIIDDTQSKKDQSTRRMEGMDYHFSHSDGKSVWSHCIVTAHVVSEGYSFALDYRSYFRDPCCSDLRPVTVGHHQYKIYSYEGNLSDTENAAFLVSWEDKYDSKSKPFCLLCTDTSLDLVTILRYYDV